jgi:hypothetical protein
MLESHTVRPISPSEARVLRVLCAAGGGLVTSEYIVKFASIGEPSLLSAVSRLRRHGETIIRVPGLGYRWVPQPGA